jgi:aldose 1-epimerase
VSVASTTWGTLPTGEPVTRFELASDRIRLGLLTWGATVQSLAVPGAGGAWTDVVLGFDSLAPYVGEHPYLGATVGRYANRIAGARFELDGASYDLVPSDGPHTLHGGRRHFGSQQWEPVDAAPTDDGGRVTLRLVSPDGDQGFPGRVEVTTTFTLAGQRVRQETTATTDAPTVVNVTNHAYVNLHGTPAHPIDDHVLLLPAEHYLPVDATAIPLAGPPAPVAGTAYDFRTPRAIGPRPYDHTWVLAGPIEVTAAGRRLRITTTEPGVQLYTGDFLDGTLVGRGGLPLTRRGGLCLETQHFPDSPHRPDYPSTVLRPGETYHTVTEWELDSAPVH